MVESQTTQGLKRVWHDPADDDFAVSLRKHGPLHKLRKTDDEDILSAVEYQERLRESFMQARRSRAHTISDKPAWLEEGSDEEVADSASEENHQDALKTDMKLTMHSASLPKTELDIMYYGGTRISCGFTRPVKYTEFHPTSDFLAVAGDKVMQLYQVGPTSSAKMASHVFPGFPITDGCFLPDASEIVVTGWNTSTTWWYNLEANTVKQQFTLPGRRERVLELPTAGPSKTSPVRPAGVLAFSGTNGYSLVIDARTRHVVRNFKNNAPVRGMAFHPDSEVMYTIDDDGGLYEWDMQSGRCKCRVQSAIGGKPKTLCLSPVDPRRLLIGTSAGTVDIVPISEKGIGKAPLKSMMNLTTAVSNVAFHPSGEVFGYASNEANAALRLVHAPSNTAFANFPEQFKSFRGKPTSLAFSKQGGLLAVGGASGVVHCFRMRHFA